MITAQLTFTSAGDNEHWVYADGVEVGHFAAYNTPNTVNIPAGTKLIAVKTYDFDTYGGLIGSFSDGVVTDGTWKCTREYRAGWETLNFDDRNWPFATATRGQGDPGAWANVPKIASNAKWIWAGSYSDTKVTAYCRKELSKYNINCRYMYVLAYILQHSFFHKMRRKIIIIIVKRHHASKTTMKKIVKY